MVVGSTFRSILTAQSTGEMKYHYGEGKKLSFGTYPTITLAEARKRRDEAKKIHADGKDPGEVKKAENLEKNLSEGRTFAAIATEWYNAKSFRLVCQLR